MYIICWDACAQIGWDACAQIGSHIGSLGWRGCRFGHIKNNSFYFCSPVAKFIIGDSRGNLKQGYANMIIPSYTTSAWKQWVELHNPAFLQVAFPSKVIFFRAPSIVDMAPAIQPPWARLVLRILTNGALWLALQTNLRVIPSLLTEQVAVTDSPSKSDYPIGAALFQLMNAGHSMRLHSWMQSASVISIHGCSWQSWSMDAGSSGRYCHDILFKLQHQQRLYDEYK